jgi:hypothetical protein
MDFQSADLLLHCTVLDTNNQQLLDMTDTNNQPLLFQGLPVDHMAHLPRITVIKEYLKSG